VPWAAEISDLWPESIVKIGAIKNPLIICALGSMELFAYRKAEVIVPVTARWLAKVPTRARSRC
jgi:hypothetical protein